MNKVESLLREMAEKLAEHQYEEKTILKGYTLGANTDMVGIQNRITEILAVIVFKKKGLSAKETFEKYCSGIPFDDRILRAMEDYANQVNTIFREAK